METSLQVSSSWNFSLSHWSTFSLQKFTKINVYTSLPVNDSSSICFRLADPAMTSWMCLSLQNLECWVCSMNLVHWWVQDMPMVVVFVCFIFYFFSLLWKWEWHLPGSLYWSLNYHSYFAFEPDGSHRGGFPHSSLPLHLKSHLYIWQELIFFPLLEVQGIKLDRPKERW